MRLQGTVKVLADFMRLLLSVAFQGVGGLCMAEGHGDFDVCHIYPPVASLIFASKAVAAWRREGSPWPRGIWPRCVGRCQSSPYREARQCTDHYRVFGDPPTRRCCGFYP